MCQNFDSKDPRTKAVTEPNFITQKIFDAVIIIISQAGVGFCVGFCTTPKTYTLQKDENYFFDKNQTECVKILPCCVKIFRILHVSLLSNVPKKRGRRLSSAQKEKFPIFIKIFFGNNFFNCQIFCRALLPLSSCSRSDLILKHPIFGTTKYLLFFFNKRLKILTRDWSTNRNSISFFWCLFSLSLFFSGLFRADQIFTLSGVFFIE